MQFIFCMKHTTIRTTMHKRIHNKRINAHNAQTHIQNYILYYIYTTAHQTTAHQTTNTPDHQHTHTYYV